MDMQAFIDAFIENSKRVSAREYSLGKLIKDLKNLDSDLIVKIDDGNFPMKSNIGYAEDGDKKPKELGFQYDKKTESVFDSWRGSYCELAMQFSDDNQNITVKELLEDAEFINGKYLCGYKGGDFLMDLQTPIHIANYGSCGELKLIGVEIKEGFAVLKTRIDNDD
jgi:hypothetical protein